jgi:hypothetical protein
LGSWAPKLTRSFASETKQKTLEDIAAAFGDKVVEVDVAVEGARRETKVVAFHVE